MLVTFSCKAHANITLFGDVAIQLLKMMGKSDTIPSAMMADEVPEALEKLRQSIDRLPKAAAQDDAQGEASVSIAHRALPLIELLQDAVDKSCHVMWK